MIITKLNQYFSFTKATIAKNLRIIEANNHKLSVQNFTESQTLSSSNKEKVVIQKEKPLLAIVFKNGDL